MTADIYHMIFHPQPPFYIRQCISQLFRAMDRKENPLRAYRFGRIAFFMRISNDREHCAIHDPRFPWIGVGNRWNDCRKSLERVSGIVGTSVENHWNGCRFRRIIQSPSDSLQYAAVSVFFHLRPSMIS